MKSRDRSNGSSFDKFNIRLRNSILLSGFLILIFSNLFAASWYVNDNSLLGDIYCTSVGSAGNSGSLPSSPKASLSSIIALAGVVNGDTVYVDKGNFNEVNLTINKSLVIIGAGPGNTVFTGNASVNRFASITADNVKIKNLTLRNYYLNANGQVITMTGRTGILFENVTIKDNQGSAASGVNFDLTNSNVTFFACVFSCSGWNADGGGTIRSTGGTLDIERCVFKEVRNFAISGNGGAIEMQSSVIVTIINSTFDNCSARRGGAIYQGSGTLIVSGSCFTDNFTAGDLSDPSNGGGAYYSNAPAGSSCSFTNCSFTGNKVSRNGDQNSSCDGGTVLFRGANGTFSFDKCSFDNISTSAFDKGQDFYLDEGTLTGTISNCSFGASTNANGGAKVNIYNFDLEGGDVIITNSSSWTFTGLAFSAIDTNPQTWDPSLSGPNTVCADPSNIAPCGSTVDCASESVAPVIFNCATDQTITDCSPIGDYTPELLAFDDCSFSIVQSPASGTLLPNGSHVITFTVSDQSPNSPDATCSITVTVSGCVCTPPPAPTGSASQSFCLSDGPTVADLSATSAGTLTWYDQPTGGTAYV
ncbi:MAG: HYR domain-containing protein, partial [Cryomorphaceae bacterium]|nr:HYR domain-containing protein [Cryomorphaceae bacterium]